MLTREQRAWKLENQVQECYKKKRYSTEDFAKSVARRCRKERNIELRIYACPQCCGWHLTHIPDKEHS